MRQRRKKSSEGLAMIMVLVMVVIFAALILAVVISSTTAIRRAHFYRDKTTALQIASAGVQEILHNMNYEKYGSGPGHLYPFGDGVEEETKVYPLGYHPEDYCLVAIDPDNTGEDTRLVSTGKYRGRSAKISVNLRGHAFTGEDLDLATNGIPETFNKKVIYANTVDIPAVTGRTLKGNITTTTAKPSPFPWPDATWTNDINISDLVLFDTENCKFFLPGAISATDTYANNGYLINSTYPSPGIEVNSLSGDGVYWDGSIYYFGRNDTGPEDFLSLGRSIFVDADVIIPSNAGNVTIDNSFSSSGSISINKNITTTTAVNTFAFTTTGFSITNGLTINGDLALKGTSLILNGNTIAGRVVCDNDITISGVATTTINGNVLSQGSIYINADTTINGSIVCNHDTISQNHTISITAPVTINATGSVYDAAILVYPYNDGATSTIGTAEISGATSITLGENQLAGILVSAYQGIITVNVPFVFTPAANPPDQFAIVNFSGDPNSAVNINANNLSLVGSVYSYKDINLNDNTQIITGILVAGDSLHIGNNSQIIYDPRPYLNNPTVYKGFTGGRRRYIPLPGSWEVTW